MNLFELNFFTTAISKYSVFTFPYIISCLLHNKNSCVELLVDHHSALTKQQREFLCTEFRGRWVVHGFSNKMSTWSSTAKLASIRWLSIPTIRAQFTYIGDVDILILENNIADIHNKHASFLNLPYSNIVRDRRTNLTGCHFVKTEQWYNKINNKYCNTVISSINSNQVFPLDEKLLYRMARDNFGLPNRSLITDFEKEKSAPYYNISFRPIHGIHCSPHRPGLISWGVTEHNFILFNALLQNPIWKRAEKLFSPLYKLNYYDKIPIAYKKHKEWLKSRSKI